MSTVLGKIWQMLAYLMLALAIGCILIVGYWWAQNTFWPSTTFRDARAVGGDVYKVGDKIRLAYIVTRYRHCRLEIGRYVRRVQDRREVLMQSVVQIITADAPPVGRPSGYDAVIPDGILNPGEKEIEAHVFSRVQYFCNGLDWAVARIVDMEPVKILVVAGAPSR